MPHSVRAGARGSAAIRHGPHAGASETAHNAPVVASKALVARWRRLDRAVDEVGLAVNSDDPARCPDSVATALDTLYDLWELWLPTLTSRADDEVRGNVDGEMAAALVHARGGKTHAHVEFGDFTDTIAERFYDHFGCWRWQPFSDPRRSAADRDRWYGTHVAGNEVLPPIEAAVRFMRLVLPPPSRI